jgi:uncharacterized delta-60 repeat protein
MSHLIAGRFTKHRHACVELLECRTFLSSGALDPTFGNGGALSGFSSIFQGGQAHAVALQADGRVVAAGGTTNNGVLPNPQFAIARFNPDGTLDPTFGTGGRVTATLGQVVGSIQALVIEPDARIVAAGYAGPDASHTHFAVMRFNADGSPDTTFGTGGITITPFTDIDAAAAVALQRDGKIVAAGSASAPDGSHRFALARYTATGSLDPTFGTAGTLMTAPGTGIEGIYSSGANAVVILRDGRIVAGGELESEMTLACFTPSGTPDPHFGKNGLASMTVPNFTESVASGLAVDRNGEIVAAGSETSLGLLIVTRFSSNGHVDRAFGTGGLFTAVFRDPTTDPGTATLDQNGQGSAVAIQKDGKIVVVGYFGPEGYHGDGGSWVAAVRLTPAGKLDPSFGTRGKVLSNTDFTVGGDLQAAAVAIQPDGRIVVAAMTQTYEDFVLMRYTRFGNLDRTFASGVVGPQTLSFTGNAGAVAEQSDGKIVVAGGDPWTVSRFLPDGTLDSSFGVGGHIPPPNDDWLNPYIGLNETPAAVSILPDGKILVGGTTSTSDGPGLVKLAEYKSDGTPVAGFGRRGFVTLALDKHAQFPYTSLITMAVQPDGKIIVGASDVVDSGITLARFTRGGSLDHSFGRGGIVRTPAFGGFDESPTNIALDSQGRILVGGAVYTPIDGTSGGQVPGFAFARYEPNGKLDASFGAGGTLMTSFGGGDGLLTMSLAADGSIVGVGIGGDAHLAVAHYDSSGKLDPQFGMGGESLSSGAPLPPMVNTAIVEPDGSFLLAAKLPSNDELIFHYTPAGQIDPAFGTGGVSTLSSSQQLPNGDVVAIQNDGKILVANGATGQLLRLSA